MPAWLYNPRGSKLQHHDITHFQNGLITQEYIHHVFFIWLFNERFIVGFSKERLEEQRNENARLMQQLETALADARRQADVQKEKALSKVIIFPQKFCLEKS